MIDYKDQILELAKSGKHLSAIAKELGLEKGSVSYFCKINKVELVSGKFKFTQEEELKLVEEYQSGMSTNKIAKKFGMKPESICGILERNGCNRRQGYDTKFSKGHTINPECFTDFNEESASYWYGFLLADGCLHNGIISLALKPSDKYMIELFKEYVGSTGKVRDVKSFNKQVGKTYEFCSFSVKDIYLEKRLIEQGFAARKSTKEVPPPFLTNTLSDRHFWRGVLDGDGHLSKNTREPVVNLVGSYDLLLKFKEFCEINCGVRPTKKIAKRKNNDLHLITYHCLEAIKIMKVIWSDYSLCLKRKEDIMLSVLKHREEKHGIK